MAVILQHGFWKAFAAWAAVLATVGGAAVTAQAGFGLRKFGGLEYVPRVTALSVVRELGPGAATSAVLFALVTWAHPLSLADIRSRLQRNVVGALLLSLLSLPAVLSVSLASSFLTGWAAYGIRWSTFYTGATQTVVPTDLVASLMAFGVNAVLVGAMAWMMLPRLARVKWSLMRKIALVWAALLAVRLCLAVLSWMVGTATA